MKNWGNEFSPEKKINKKGSVVKNWGNEFSPEGFNDNRKDHFINFFARRALTLNVYEDTWICWLIPFGKKNLDMLYSIVIHLLPENYVTIPLA